MITKIADNIISPLGLTTDENFKAISEGDTKLMRHQDEFELPEAFYGSLMDRDFIETLASKEIKKPERFSFFEKLCIISAKRALNECHLDASSNDVVFVVSTTKGNVDKLAESLECDDSYLAETALKISRYFDNKNTPLVVSNACISGVCAQIAAIRQLLGGEAKYAVVIGCDILSKFIVSGFQAFKAISEEPCKPFDKERVGLNLGEAVGTIILKSGQPESDTYWQYVSSSIHNDANHISGPSRTGQGSFLVLTDILKTVSTKDIAFVNVHGTSTPYNDEMESIALHRAEFDEVPVNGLKGYFGHTLGAAGIIETLLSMKAIDNGMVVATKGFNETGTSFVLNISNRNRATTKQMFIKILSGFGGSNAGICYKKGGTL